MDVVTCAGSFLLGGVSAIIIMGLLLFFIENPLKKRKEEYCLKKIILAQLPLTDFKGAEKTTRSRDADQLTEGQISPNPIAAAYRFGMCCNTSR